MTKPRSIVILTARAGFPNGAGAAARVRTWAKAFGLTRIDNPTPNTIGLLGPDRDGGPALNTDVSGLHDGTSFRYAAGSVRCARGFWGRAWLAVRSTFGLVSALCAAARKSRVVAIYYYMPEHVSYLGIAYIGSRVLGAKLIGERTEAETRMKGWRRAVFEACAYKLFDGYVVISEFLRGYMAPRLRRNARLVVVPILVDVTKATQRTWSCTAGRRTTTTTS